VVSEVRVIALVRMSVCSYVETDSIVKHGIKVAMQFLKAIETFIILPTADEGVVREG
jgi:hypothetical protein